MRIKSKIVERKKKRTRQEHQEELEHKEQQDTNIARCFHSFFSFHFVCDQRSTYTVIKPCLFLFHIDSQMTVVGIYSHTFHSCERSSADKLRKKTKTMQSKQIQINYKKTKMEFRCLLDAW